MPARLWLHALVAFLVMWMLGAVLGGLDLRDSREFGGFAGGLIFVAFVSVPYLVPPTLLVFVPVVAAARASSRQWTRGAALLVGVALSPAAMAFTVIASWLLEGARPSFRTHLEIVFTQNPHRILTLMVLYAIGGAIVAWTLRAGGERASPPAHHA